MDGKMNYNQARYRLSRPVKYTKAELAEIERIKERNAQVLHTFKVAFESEPEYFKHLRYTVDMTARKKRGLL